MCGIFGQLERQLDPSSARRFAAAATNALKHRGPDGDGLFLDEQCLLGHTRLAILDLSDAAAQPMTSASGRSVLTFNGEAYNYVELRERLARADSLRSSGDTEVLLELLEEHGVDALREVNGMFAFGWWNPARRELLLARDRFGKKPLYWMRTPTGGIKFASEIAGLFADGGSVRTSADRIAEFLQYSYNLAPRTSFLDVSSLAPASWLLARIADDGTIQTQTGSFWQLPPWTPESAMRLESWSEELADTLANAVTIRMRADVPVGIFLSGGVDSSIIALLAQRASNKRLRTLTTDFSDKSFSEADFAEDVARSISADHERLELRPPELEDVDQYVRLFGELQGDVAGMATLAVSRATRAITKVGLTGDGGDELMGGYFRYKAVLQSVNASARLPPILRRAMALGGEHFPAWLRGDGHLGLYGADVASSFVSTTRQFPTHPQPPLFKQRVPNVADPVLEAMERHAHRPPLLRMMAADAETYIPADTSVCLDRTSMSVGLELRSPLLDYRLFDLISRARVEWIADATSAKKAFRRLYASQLPAHVFERKKVGFHVPVESWVRGASFERIQERLLDRGSRLYDVLDRRAVERLLTGFRWHIHRGAARVWHLLVLDIWLSQWRPSIQ